MKRNLIKKLTAVVLLIAMTVMTAVSALAASSGRYNVTGDSELLSQLNQLPPFKFEKHKKGIGYGSCPIYSAPSYDAYRTANGKSSCQTNAAMDDAGFVDGWLLVRYETNKGSYNVGYIPPKYVKNFKSKMGPHFGYIPAMANESITVTNNPMSHKQSMAELAPGETFYVISKYNYYASQGLEWWYIEFTVDGQVARGFIDISSSFQLGYGEG